MGPAAALELINKYGVTGVLVLVIAGLLAALQRATVRSERLQRALFKLTVSQIQASVKQDAANQEIKDLLLSRGGSHGPVQQTRGDV